MSDSNEIPRDDSARFDTRNAPDEKLVERLLSAAGPGPKIPDGGADRVKAAIRPEWKNEVAGAARQRRRLWGGALAAAAAVIVAVVVVPRLQNSDLSTGPAAITLEVVSGGIEVTAPGSMVSFLGPDDAGAVVPDGSLVRTRPGHRAALRLTGGQSLRIDDSTTVRLDSERSISLDSGAVYISSADVSGPGVEVRTAFGTATEIGTQFVVRLEGDTLEVAVREGLVALVGGEDEYRITHGIRLSMDGRGEVATAPIAAYDPAWAWTQEIAPPFAIEGRTALAYLDWVSAETGLSVRFADAAVEMTAATTLLHGTIGGLTPAESPVAVLPTCGLTAEEEPGVLVVGAIGSTAQSK